MNPVEAYPNWQGAGLENRWGECPLWVRVPPPPPVKPGLNPVFIFEWDQIEKYARFLT